MAALLMPVAFNPDWRVAPGETLHEMMEERGWTIYHLSELSGLPLGALQAILDGVGKIDEPTAYALGVATGVQFRFWLNLEAQYRKPL